MGRQRADRRVEEEKEIGEMKAEIEEKSKAVKEREGQLKDAVAKDQLSDGDGGEGEEGGEMLKVLRRQLCDAEEALEEATMKLDAFENKRKVKGTAGVKEGGGGGGEGCPHGYQMYQ
jgi:hypothetical protein